MQPCSPPGTGRRSSVSTCRKLAALRADRFRPRRRGGRRVWRRSAAAAMRLPRGDTLLTHHGNWSSKAAEAYHISERAADMESGASAVAELVGGVTSRSQLHHSRKSPAVQRTTCVDTSKLPDVLERTPHTQMQSESVPRHRAAAVKPSMLAAPRGSCPVDPFIKCCSSFI